MEAAREPRERGQVHVDRERPDRAEPAEHDDEPDAAQPLARYARHTGSVDDERAPICPVCGVTMVPAELSAHGAAGREWVWLECEETGEQDDA